MHKIQAVPKGVSKFCPEMPKNHAILVNVFGFDFRHSLECSIFVDVTINLAEIRQLLKFK